MSPIRFEAELYKIGTWTILRLPKSASAQLPSRGMTMVEGTINGFSLKAPLEPDGKGSHWLRVDATLLEATGAEVGDTVQLEIAPAKEWTEPALPDDLQSALGADPGTHALWLDCTTIARWDWIRWINATAQQETRRRRIEVAFSKLQAGARRPCCFNRSMCTEPYVSKNGVLLEQTEPTAANA
ncbi:MAG TPA: YdeI/OmpD-associated family protein [Chloroflexia bacterium]|nr:YdeI/OmpD-associated family protein [Chloroflexia bacterium]